MNMPSLDEEKFNLEIRKFLKKVGINSQREIERAVREGLVTQLATEASLERADRDEVLGGAGIGVGRTQS